MCFGRSSSAEADDQGANISPRPVNTVPKERNPAKMSYAPPPGPPPSHRQQEDTYAPPSGPPPSHRSGETYAPPPGPPPSHRHEEYAPPAGPPPSHRDQEYAPPPGPPPSHQQQQYAPPPGPPPSHSNETYAPPPGPPPGQAPYHDWQTAVPDTSLLPPPPSLGNQRSATNNATEQEAEQGEAWCAQNPLLPPFTYPREALTAIHQGNIAIIKPRPYIGELDRAGPGHWHGKTKSSSPDSCILSAIPLYSVVAHSPLTTGRPKTIYYEVKISRHNRREVSLAIGFTAMPYPTFRLPGWHRASLAVHGDDGSKFINDRWGGKDFTSAFQPGEVLGLGMTFSPRNVHAPPSYDRAKTTNTGPIDVEIFLTRNGRRVDGWNLHEEGDAVEDLPVDGLEGTRDLFAAVGTFEAVEFEIVFNSSMWMYRPEGY
ncbi:hypothetical protein F5884DRAFT_778240 [Xylogone sp. PMI_703]|nr:hypothetical protein F5884DRAFT_778240 [Xylogone sp. PMI_703]